jgi:outer membrane lipoprotein-sorting protein
MSKRTFWITMAAGALGVALIALPGISAKKQEVGPATLAQLQERLQELQSYSSDEAPGGDKSGRGMAGSWRLGNYDG